MITPCENRLKDVKIRTMEILNKTRDQNEVTIPKTDLYTLIACLNSTLKTLEKNGEDNG